MKRNPRREGPRGAVHLSDTYYAGVGAAIALLTAVAVAISSTGLMAGFDSWPVQPLLNRIGSVQIGGGGDANRVRVAAVRKGAEPTTVQNGAASGAGGNGHQNAGSGSGGDGSGNGSAKSAPLAATPAPATEPGHAKGHKKEKSPTYGGSKGKGKGKGGGKGKGKSH
jgi:hypothetical protein